MEVDDVIIPLGGSNNVLQIRPNEVDENILDILVSERAPLKSWLDTSKAFIAQGDNDAFARTLDRAIKIDSRSEKFQKIQALCTLAMYNIEEAKVEKDITKKSSLEARARGLLNQAENLDRKELLPRIGLGELALYKGEIDVAKREFEMASKRTCNGKPSIAGTLALARFHFGRGDTRQALSLYQQSLKAMPTAPPEVRLGIAACQFKLGNAAKADAAFSRVLELDPECTQALLGLAALKLAVGASAEDVREGSQLLARAFQLDPDSPRTLCLLAQFTLKQGFNDSAKKMAQAAIDRSLPEENQLKAEAYTTLARAHHSAGELREAMTAYLQANQLDKKLPLPRLGLAQFNLLNRDKGAAAGELERLLNDVPAWVDALKILGAITTRGDQRVELTDGAAKQYEEAAARAPDDPSLWELLGDVFASSRPSSALAAYQKAIKLHRDLAAVKPEEGSTATPHIIPSRLLNNTGVLLMQSGEITAARALIQEALSHAADDPTLGDIHAFIQVTLGYNIARLKEAAGDLGSAEKEYTDLVETFPQYADCYLRLACIAKARGDVKGAEKWTKKAAEIGNRSADANALLTSMYMERKDYESAKKVIDDLSRNLAPGESKHEMFAKVAMGNIYLYSAHPALERSTKEDGQKKAETQLTYALQMYLKALEKDPGNVYAANGIGCCLAEAGRYLEAKEIFLQVQAAAASTGGFITMPDAWINLANVYLGMGEFQIAGQAYASALRRFYNNRNARVLLYMSRTQYDAAQTDTLQLRAALKLVQRALHLEPWNHRLRFNVAYLLSEAGTRELTRPRPENDSNKPADFRVAVGELDHAFHLFNSLLQAGKDVTGLDDSRLRAHMEHCQKFHPAGLEYLKHADQEAKLRQLKREQILFQEEAAAREKAIEEQRKAEEEKAAAKLRAEASIAHQERVERFKKDMKDAAKMRKAVETGDVTGLEKGRNRANEPDAVDALFAVDDDEEDAEYQPGQESDGEGAPADGGQAELGTAALLGAGSLSDDDEADFDFNEEEDDEDGDVNMAEAGEGGDADGGKLTKKKLKKKQAKEGKKLEKKVKKPEEKKKASGGGGRLKKRAREETDGVKDAGLEDDVEMETGGDDAEAAAKKAKDDMHDLFGSDSD